MPKYKWWYSLIILIVLTVPIVWPLFQPGYFSHHDNLQVMRIFEMRRCFNDGQLPCRWVPDMGYGNGFPLFNYYGVLAYYIGGLATYLTSYLIAAKLLFFLPLAFAGISMYLLARKLYGEMAGLTAGVLYLLAPYRAVDSYVRGAIAESFAMALIPLVLWLFIKLVETRSYKYTALTSLGLVAFLISHNIMTLFFLPVIIGWNVILLLNDHRAWKSVLLASVLGVGMALFFLLPAFMEKSLVQTETLTRMDLNFRGHFVTVGQLFFNRQWGYGASIPGPADTISFQIGWPLWWLVVMSGLLFIKPFIRNLQNRSYKTILLPTYLFIVFGLSVIMMHNQSAFIWEAISLLPFAQFPWRFLSISIVSGALLSAFLINQFSIRWQPLLTAGVVIITVLLNTNYFQPERYFYDLNDQQLLTGPLWEEQQRAAILDYLPRISAEPKEGAPLQPIVHSGNAQISNFDKRSNSWTMNSNADQIADIEMPIFDFPIWQVKVDGQLIEHHHNNLLGRIEFNLPKGEHQVEGSFGDTPVRTVANTISLLSLLLTLGILVYGKSRSNHN